MTPRSPASKRRMGNKDRSDKRRSSVILVILRVISYILSLFGILLTVSLEWLKTTWGPVSFSTALFQLKTPMVGVDTNVVRTYVTEIAMPAVLKTLGAIILLCVIAEAMKVTGYSLKLGAGRKCRPLDITYRPVLAVGTVAILIICWCRLPALAKQTGVPDYVDSLINRSTIYEEYYVVPEESIIHFPEQRRNLIMIYAESIETTYASVEEGGGKPVSLIPNLRALAGDNISFSDDDGFGGATQTQNIGWTMAALLSSTSGATYNLPIDTNDMQSYSTFLPGLITIGDVLYDNGYDNYFACGSDVSFGGRRAYFNDHGSYVLQDYCYALESGYLPEGYHNGFWGMEDVRLFEMAKAELTAIAQGGRPFNYTILTADTHPPEGYVCDQCDPRDGEPPLETAIRCSDRTIASFIDWAEEQDWYDNTTIVVVGDHLLMSESIFGDIPEGYQRHVYNCFINVCPGLAPVNCHNRVFSTTDYFPTVLASIGVQIDGDRLGLGTNLFSDRQTLLEELGQDTYNTEVLRHSEYYFNNFV